MLTELRVEEVPPAEEGRFVTALAWLLGFAVSAVLIAIGIPVNAALDGGDVGAGAVVLAAVLVGGMVARSVLRSQQAALRRPPTTTFAPTGLTRVDGEERLAATWQQVTSLVVRRGRLASPAEVLVVATEPALALVAGDRRSQAKGRLNAQQFGGAVVLPRSALPLADDELDRVVAHLSGGTRGISRDD